MATNKRRKNGRIWKSLIEAKTSGRKFDGIVKYLKASPHKLFINYNINYNNTDR